MLRFTLFGIPVSIHWMFWLIALIFGSSFVDNGDTQGFLVWMSVWFLSFMIHEFGHAFAFRRLGARPSVHLYGMGGYATAAGRFTRRQSIFVSAAGPLVEIAAGVLCLLLLMNLPIASKALGLFLSLMAWICIFWGVLNLAPILPLDGGHILEAIMGGSPKMVALISIATGVVIAIAFVVLMKAYIAAAFFGYLAFRNWQRWKGVPQSPGQPW